MQIAATAGIRCLEEKYPFCVLFTSAHITFEGLISTPAAMHYLVERVMVVGVSKSDRLKYQHRIDSTFEYYNKSSQISYFFADPPVHSHRAFYCASTIFSKEFH